MTKRVYRITYIVEIQLLVGSYFWGCQGEGFPLNILFMKQDYISLKSILFEGFQGKPPLIILLDE